LTLKLKLQLAISAAVLVTSVVLVRYAVGSIRSQAAADIARIRAEKTAEVKRDLADKVDTVYALIDDQYQEAADERYLEQKYGRRLRGVLDVAGATRILVASLAVVALAVLAVSFFAASLTRPLAKLVGLSRDIAEDEKNLSRRIGLRSKDEIGQLAVEFDHMAERVESSLRHVREERALLQSVLSNIPHGIFWKDRRTVYLGCNDGFAQRFGLPSAEAVVGKSDAQLGIGAEQLELQARRDRLVLESGEALLDEREILRDPSGRETCCLASRVPLRDAAGSVIGMLGVLVAIPEGISRRPCEGGVDPQGPPCA
jgi:PAS domain S-box-containing protein